MSICTLMYTILRFYEYAIVASYVPCGVSSATVGRRVEHIYTRSHGKLQKTVLETYRRHLRDDQLEMMCLKHDPGGT